MSKACEESKKEVAAFIAASSLDWSGTPELECQAHPEEPAVASCAACGKLACAKCLCELGGEILCEPCALERARKGVFARVYAAFKQPVFWVSACIAVSGALYACGVGNPGAEELAKADAGRAWHKRDAASAYLAQGARERRRSAVLESKGESADARRWAAMSSESFGRAALLWGDSPASFAPALASAEALAKAGSPSEALTRALAIKAPGSDEDLASYHFMLARIADAAGDKALSLEGYRKALEAAGKARVGVLESLLSSYANDRREASFAEKVRRVSGLGLSSDEIYTEARRHLGEAPKERDIEDAAPPPKANPKPGQGKAGGDFEIEVLDGKGAR